MPSPTSINIPQFIYFQLLVSGVFSDPPTKSRAVPDVPGPLENLSAIAGLPVNFAKNRYRDILPFDSTRVKIDTPHQVGGDFINANYTPVCCVADL